MPRSVKELPWPWVTPRLTIRPVTPSDSAAMWRYRRLPEVHAWLPSAPPDEAAFATLMADPVRQARTLVVELDDRVVGDLYLALSDSWAMAEAPGRGEQRDAEVGWAFDSAYHGRGLATEAVRALVGRCFEELEVHRVTAITFAANVDSWRLMERLGMRRETEARQDALHRDGRWYDSVGYALLASEWPSLARLS